MEPAEDEGTMAFLDLPRRHSRALFRGGLFAGFASFGLYLAFGQIAGGEAVDASPLGRILVLASFAGAIATLAGALLLPRALIYEPPRSAEGSSSEAFLRLAERAEKWIERARRYILLGGLFGGVVWIPLMLFGLFAGPPGDASFDGRVLSIGGTLAFVAVAILWWRRVVEIDRELRQWRSHMARLRSIETSLLAEP